MTQFAHASEDPRWLTYLQASERGCQVRRGERGTPVIFFKRLDVADSGREGSGDGEATARRIPMLRSFTAFHASQVDGLAEYQAPTPETAPWRRPEAVEVIVAASGVPVRFGGDRAAYSPALDAIAIPPPAAFRTPEGFAATLAHELGHASGHESRLARDLGGRFGSHLYAYEELVAELISLTVCSTLGLACDIENHASYLQSWLELCSPRHKSSNHKLARIIHEKCAIKAKPLISFTTMRIGCLMKFFAMKSLAQVFGGLGRFRAVR